MQAAPRGSVPTAIQSGSAEGCLFRGDKEEQEEEASREPFNPCVALHHRRSPARGWWWRGFAHHSNHPWVEFGVWVAPGWNSRAVRIGAGGASKPTDSFSHTHPDTGHQKKTPTTWTMHVVGCQQRRAKYAHEVLFFALLLRRESAACEEPLQ